MTDDQEALKQMMDDMGFSSEARREQMDVGEQTWSYSQLQSVGRNISGMLSGWETFNPDELTLENIFEWLNDNQIQPQGVMMFLAELVGMLMEREDDEEQGAFEIMLLKTGRNESMTLAMHLAFVIGMAFNDRSQSLVPELIAKAVNKKDNG